MRKNRRITALLLGAALLSALFAGCASAPAAVPAETAAPAAVRAEQAGAEVDLAQEEQEQSMVPLSGEPAAATALMPAASGTDVRKNDKAEIDASNTADGYVMVRTLEPSSAKRKVITTGPSGVKYTYNLNSAGMFDVFPLSDGNGTYKITVYRSVSGSRYSVEYSTTVTAQLKDEFAPFLLPNQYVNYTAASQTVKKAAELTKNSKDELASIKAVYGYVVTTLTYDKQRAATVQSGYLPDLDAVLAAKKGICFDYAALMTAMLRSRGIPCKLVVGYAGTVYHSWINAYSKEKGWISGVIYFDGAQWKLMDPTFASTGKSSSSIMKYIGDGNNYTAKYLY